MVLAPISPTQVKETQAAAHKRSRSVSDGEDGVDSAELADLVAKRQKQKRGDIKKEIKKETVVNLPKSTQIYHILHCDMI